ncbi:aspartate aminotransferase P1 [Capsaspora owczarzaki ATCC 30864]|uniref:Aspartate aminotransferase n=1 Tax=Capsaspora owczarzaki (strain ATCC 30864) TaxID=595528 RepID=A0A0D2WIA4_CAPO3|nr:aspartate aminotransferase P1 [Capsaspora owczarzaki ATCC 30864]KJE89550.1 aspartate aminotransferase P1 [Capsaspora owczarzaki ATCC 30864]|eukprot:XP_004365869.1 aspartate aminotransferase P1 [Capsaspora owczarzaki ATCC 30864]
MSHFATVPLAPPDAIFGVAAACTADKHPNKVDLVIGAYRTEECEPWILPVVRQTELRIAETQHDHEYLSIDGLADFTNASARFVLGHDSKDMAEGRVCAVQAISGTGALRLGGEFLRRFYTPSQTIYVSDPTWSNHFSLFKEAGLTVKTYRYFDKATKGVAFTQFVEDLNAMPEGSIVLLHACAHNPTGADPSREQWAQLADLFIARKLFPFFDSAYQGFATGDVDNDAYAVRLFAARGIELFIGQSYSKNFGLYNERAGCITAVAADKDAAQRMRSQFKLIVRAMFSNPPNHGARIVGTILNSPELYKDWHRDLNVMADRIKLMRRMLYDKLVELKTPGSWQHILDQIGMFSFTGLTEAQCKVLTEKYHIYLLSSGRINMCGLTTKTVDYVGRAILDVVSNAGSA